MALVINDEPVYEQQENRKIADAGTVLDDSNPIVLAHAGAFRPLQPEPDEAEGARVSAATANPDPVTGVPPASDAVPTEALVGSPAKAAPSSSPSSSSGSSSKSNK